MRPGSAKSERRFWLTQMKNKRPPTDLPAWRFKTRQRRGTRSDMCDLARKFAVSAILTALLTQPSYAQQFPESDRQKAQEERKKADVKATDEAYKALMKRLPDGNKNVDPWGGVRLPSATPGK
jgi:hypothetical protein